MEQNSLLSLEKTSTGFLSERELAEEHGLELVDLREAFDGDSRWWGDSVHFSAEGSERAAQLLAAAVEPMALSPAVQSPACRCRHR